MAGKRSDVEAATRGRERKKKKKKKGGYGGSNPRPGFRGRAVGPIGLRSDAEQRQHPNQIRQLAPADWATKRRKELGRGRENGSAQAGRRVGLGHFRGFGQIVLQFLEGKTLI